MFWLLKCFGGHMCTNKRRNDKRRNDKRQKDKHQKSITPERQTSEATTSEQFYPKTTKKGRKQHTSEKIYTQMNNIYKKKKFHHGCYVWQGHSLSESLMVTLFCRAT